MIQVPSQSYEDEPSSVNPYLLQLQNEGVDVEFYLKYYDLMAQTDLPIHNMLGIINCIDDMCNIPDAIDTVHDAVKAWRPIQESYDSFDLTLHNEHTGLSILTAMKPLVSRFMQLLLEYQKAAEEATDRTPDLPDELVEIQLKILDLTRQHGALLAYRVYRAKSH